MEKTCKIDLGTVEYWIEGKDKNWNAGKKHRVIVELYLKNKGENEFVFAACGEIKTVGKRGDRVYREAGQCLDTINELSTQFTPKNRKLWNEIYRLWKSYHMNDKPIPKKDLQLINTIINTYEE